jgi:hypothetical protein
MGATVLADVINPQALAEQIMALFPRNLVLANTGAVFTDPDPLIARGGTQYTIPRWKRIAKFQAFAGTAFGRNNLTSGEEVAKVIRRGGSYPVEDVAALVSRSDPAAEIRSQLVERAADSIDEATVAMLNGAIPAANTVDVAVTTGTAVKMSKEQMLAGMAKLGDQMGKLAAVVVHSKVYVDMLTEGLIEFAELESQAGSIMRTGQVPFYLGKRVLVSDGCTVDTTTPSYFKYNSYLLAERAIYLAYQQNFQVETDRDIEALLDIIVAHLHAVVHLYGRSFTGSPASAYGPTDAELAVGGNYSTIVEDTKSIGAVKIVTN